eukprot:3332037-Prymnesium_polylepis.1
MSVAETAATDPQQRLVLEHGYAALHAMGCRRGALVESGCGVAVGIYATEFAQVLAQSPLARSVYASTASLSIASGRVSFVLGMQGPCASFETACSASLVACHSATRGMQLHECDTHLVVGVNLMLLPSSGFAMATAGMTSATGRSHTFDSRADGFVRSEGASTFAMRCCVGPMGIRGSAVRQDGRSASLTAPNGQAQQRLLRAALTAASTAADVVSLIEAHGTGTALGDPIEAGSLNAAVVAM